ncbi:MAG TPA: hypothetical protein VIX86_02960 [Streptosporangiaceae bacterium]
MENLNGELAEVEAACPAWHAWEGVVAGMLYARRLMSSPPRIVRAASADGLVQAIEADEIAHGERPPRLPCGLAVVQERHRGWLIAPTLPGSPPRGFIAVQAATGRRVITTTLTEMDAALAREPAD